MLQPIIAVYIVASKRNGTIYTGVTSDLSRRIFEHKEAIHPGFTKKYGCKTLVWYQQFERITDAIAREKQIKRFTRLWKLNLIEQNNNEWRDLYTDLY
ncbi:MAG: GIY-YIG nuclease family protein [Candidatus Pacebacteria bacterium]|nr:GIY-YIG nuclease family protein [Candidatus Paceibacterota bacterium]